MLRYELTILEGAVESRGFVLRLYIYIFSPPLSFSLVRRVVLPHFCCSGLGLGVGLGLGLGLELELELELGLGLGFWGWESVCPIPTSRLIDWERLEKVGNDWFPVLEVRGKE